MLLKSLNANQSWYLPRWIRPRENTMLQTKPHPTSNLFAHEQWGLWSASDRVTTGKYQLVPATRNHWSDIQPSTTRDQSITRKQCPNTWRQYLVFHSASARHCCQSLRYQTPRKRQQSIARRRGLLEQSFSWLPGGPAQVMWRKMGPYVHPKENY